MHRIKSLLKNLVNSRAAGVYLLLFAFSIGTATFIENDFGTSAAQKIVYQSWWFELLLVLFAASIVYNIFKFRMIPQRKWALLVFHTSIIIILIGAAVTRYFGYEGIMHIREGSASHSFLSAKSYLLFDAETEHGKFKFDEPVLFASLGSNDFDESYLIDGHLVQVELLDFIPNPKQELVTDDDGKPTIQIVMAGAGGREEYFIQEGDQKMIGSSLFNFTNTVIPGAINLFYTGDQLEIEVSQPTSQMVMATQQQDTLMPGLREPAKLRSLHSDGQSRYVFAAFSPKGATEITSEDRKIQNSSLLGMRFHVTIDGVEQETFVSGYQGTEGQPATVHTDKLQLSIAYGSKPIELPFSISLYDFIMERYPGTNSAASYASEVRLEDPAKGVNMDYRIFMNHILDYEGYRFFQSSFDRDEKGTYLSVNHDFWGTWISYIGYILLTLGLLMVFFSKNTRFHQLRKKVNKQSSFLKTAGMVALMLTAYKSSAQQNIAPSVSQISEVHADYFSQVVVQDVRGRMKPMHTLTRELMRKVSGSEHWNDLNADQAILGMYANPQEWYGIPLIKIGRNEELRKLLEIQGKHLAYRDAFNTDGSYKLTEPVRNAMQTTSAERSTYEKELIKLDERINILGMVFSGSIFKILPVPGDENHTWVSSMHLHQFPDFQTTANRFFSAYQQSLRHASHSGDYSEPNKLLADLQGFQTKNAADILPSERKIASEIWLNNSHIFNHLGWIYFLLGLGFLVLLFISVFKPEASLKYPYYLLLGLVLLGFTAHTIGLGMRWYVSGRAPWSNGYESMIYIAYTSVLAGIIFTRKSLGGLAATMILGGTLLLIALLSFLDPEITPLVPVLKSYWLTIHVSLEAGSYGFLMLGAIIGLINLLLFASLTENNKTRVKRIISEMTNISEMTLIGGLVMVSIGTYLGGVWANESWGRYWGWDAKETWALVTVLVYAFILHMRIIPRLNSLYNFNLASLFGLATVIMTYFGVNYYLSGLHSYAAGDPVPIPLWVHISVAVLIVISVFAWVKKRKFGL